MRAELTKPGGNDSARKGNVRPFVGGGLNARVVIEITVALFWSSKQSRIMSSPKKDPGAKTTPCRQAAPRQITWEGGHNRVLSRLY